MSRGRPCLAVAAALSLLLSPLPTRASPPGKDPASKDKQAAQKLLTEGNRLSGEGEYLEALARFREAYSRYPSPKLLLNIGTTLRQLGRNVEAAETYERYLADPEAEPRRRIEVRRALDEIEALVAHLRVTVSPSDAAVSLDGAPLPIAARESEVRVEPGIHKLAGEKQGLPPALQTLTLARGERRTVALALTPFRLPKPPSPLRNAGWITGAIGAVTLVGGAAAGAVALSERQKARDHCDAASAHCDMMGDRAADAARKAATASTALFILGGATLGTGIVLLAVSRPTEAKPRIGLLFSPTGVRLTLGGEL